MSWLKAIVAEIWGLFVDDSGLALGALAWAGAMWLLVSRGYLGEAAGPILFGGLAVVLMVSVLRRSGRRM